MSWSQQDTSFKKLSNKRVTTSTGKGLPEEKGASTLELYLPDIKTETIPGTGNTAYGLNGPLFYHGPTAAFGQTLVVDTSVPGNMTWFATSGYGNTTTANDGSAGSEANRLMNWVSDKYDAFGTVSGAGYEIKLYDGSNNLVTKSDASNWLFDYQTGILLFNNATLSSGSAVSTSGPYKIVGWRYVGQKGTIPAYYGGSGYTTYTKGDLLVGAGGTFIKFNVGSDNYILSADSSTASGLKWVVNSGSGSGISALNGLTASTQDFAVGTSGSLFNIVSFGSTHTFNIPIAGSGATGLVSTGTQTFAGQKTFTSAIIGDLTGTATTATNILIGNAGSNTSHYLTFSSPATSSSGIALSSNNNLTYNPSGSGTLSLGSGQAIINGLTLGATSNTITTSSGNLTLNSAGGTVVVSGNFNVQGTATYIDSTTATLTDPVVVLGAGAGGTHSTVTDTQDRGIEYRRFSGSAITGFFGYSNSSGRFTFIPNANVTANNTYSGSIGVIEANITGSAITATNIYGALIGNASTATTAGLATTAQNVYVTGQTTGTFYPVFTNVSSTTNGVALSVESSLSWDAATNTLTAGKFSGVASGIAATYTNIYGNLVGSATTAGVATTAFNVNIVSANTGTFYPLFTSNSSTSSGVAISVDGSDISYNFATNTLTAGTFSGNLSATAATATNFYGTLVGNLSGSATTSQNVNIVSAIAGTFYPLFTNVSSSASGVALSVDSGISFDAATDTLIAGKFSGLATGSAATFTNFYGTLTGLATTATTAQNILSATTSQNTDITVALLSGTAISYNSSLVFNPSTGRLAATSYTGTWAGSTITAFYGGTGNTIYSKGDLLVGIGGTLIRLAVGADNLVLTASSSSATGLTWSPTAATGITTLNTLTATTQFFSTGTSGSTFNISSSGSTHTFNIPIAGTGSTGLVSTLAQSFAGTKTFTGDVIITSSTASTYMANGALTVNGGVGISGQLSVNQVAMGYTGIATNPVMAFIGSTNAAPITMSVLSDGSLLYEGSSGKLFGINNNLSSGWIFNVGDISGLPILRANADGTIAMAEFAANVGIGLSNPSYKLHVAGDTNLSTGYVFRINGTSVLSATSLGTGVTNSSLTALGTITTGIWAGTAITPSYGGTGLTTYTVGDILYASGSSTLARLAAGTAGSILISAGAGATPYYGSTALISVGNATTSANINVVSAIAGTFYPLFTNISSSASGVAVSVDSAISYNATTDTLTAGKFSGLASGTAATYTNIYGTLTGSATTATNVNSVSTTGTNSSHFLMFSPVNGGSGVALSSGIGLTFNPSSGQLGLGTGSALINGLLLGTSANTITTTSGNLTLNSAGGTVLVAGNINVQGTATYIDSTTATITDPVVVLGSGAGGTHTNITDTQDRGIEYRRFSGSAITGFFGFSNASGRFTFIPNANLSAANTYTGSIGVIEANITGTAITSTNFFGTLVGNAASATTAGLATTAQNLNISATTTGTLYPLFTSISTTASGVAVSVDGTDISYDAASNTLTAGKFSGLHTGTAATFTNIYGPLTGTATTAQNLNIVSSTTGTFYPLFTNVSSSASGVAVSVDSGISFDSATDTLTAGKFSGLASGSAATFTNFYGTLTGNVTGTATTAQNVNIVAATAGTFYPIFTNLSSTASGVAISVDGGLSWNSASDTLVAGTFSGNLSATAATAANFYGTFVGTATSATNINIVTAGSNAAHPLVFTPASGSGSGVAVSSRSTLSFNPSTNILSVSGLAVTANTTSTSSTTGALIVTGGVGIGGTVYTATDVNIGNSTTGRLYFSQATLGSAGTTVIPTMAFIGATNSPITLSVLADNSLSFDGSSGQLFSINNNLSTGWIFAVNDISGLPLLRANADGTVAMGEFAGNIGIGISNPSYKLHVVGDTNLSSGSVYRINGTSVLSSTSLGTGVTNSSLTAVGTITTGSWAGSTITARYGGTGYTNYTKGDLLVGAGGTFIRFGAGNTNQILIADSNAGSGLSWAQFANPTYGSFYSTSIQQVAGAGVTTPLNFNATYEANRVAIIGGSGTSSRIQIQDSGPFSLTFSAQINLISGNQPKVGDFWFRINGQDVPQSNTEMSITGKDYQTVITVNFVNTFTANDYVEIMMSSADSQFSIEAKSSLTSPPRPDIPSIILSVLPVTHVIGSSGTATSGIQVLNGSVNTTQYFQTGTGGTDFNISTAGAYHTFNIPDASTVNRGLINSGSQTFLGSKTFASGVAITASTTSTSTSTGALVVSGGVGIGGSLYSSTSFANSISGVVLSNGVITSGSWSGSTITGLYGGTGYTNYTKGDLLVGAGNTFVKLSTGTDGYVLGANSNLPSGLGWTTVSGVAISTSAPAGPKNADLWFNSEDGSLSVYYQDVDTSQWVEIAIGSGIDLTNDVHITSTTGSTNSSTGALIVDGGVGIAGTVNAQSFVINGTYDQIGTTLTTSATTANQVALTLSSSVYRSAKIFVQASSGSTFHAQEIMMLHDGSNVYMTEYAMVNSGAIGSTFDGDISGGNMRFLVTPTYAVTTYKIACSAMRI